MDGNFGALSQGTKSPKHQQDTKVFWFSTLCSVLINGFFLFLLLLLFTNNSSYLEFGAAL